MEIKIKVATKRRAGCALTIIAEEGHFCIHWALTIALHLVKARTEAAPFVVQPQQGSGGEAGGAGP